MKANEFIKKYGVDEARKYLKQFDGLDHVYMGDGFYIDDLKRLIESHELVEKCGGYEQAKLIIQAIPNCLKFYDELGCLMFNPIIKRYFQFSNGVSYAFLGSAFSVDMYGKSANRIKNDCIYIHDLKKSIADVESCQ